MEKIVLVSMLTTTFMKGFVGFINSLLYHNKWFNLPILVIDINLSDVERDLCRSFYSNIEFIKPNKNMYKRVNWTKTKYWLRNTYYTLDIFNYTDYDRVVFIDIDTLILGDISYIFNVDMKNNVGGVQCYKRSSDSLINEINAGMMVIDNSKLPEDTYKKIVKYCEKGFQFPEQETINEYFKDKIDFLPKEYNVEKRMLFSNSYPFNIDDIKILHYVSLKPWQTKMYKVTQKKERIDYGELEKLWWEYYNNGDNL